MTHWIDYFSMILNETPHVIKCMYIHNKMATTAKRSQQHQKGL